MNFADLKKVLDISLSRPDLESSYGDWVNQGLTNIYQDVSWNAMRHSTTVTISAGESFAALPADFKELTPARTPIYLSDAQYSMMPVDVTRREDIIRLRNTHLSPAAVNERGATQVYLGNNGVTWTLNLIDEATSEMTFTVSYFRLLPKFTDDADENHITRSYSDMVKAKIKAVGFGEINDPLFAMWEGAYEKFRAKAAIDDARRWTQGRRVQMGS